MVSDLFSDFSGVGADALSLPRVFFLAAVFLLSASLAFLLLGVPFSYAEDVAGDDSPELLSPSSGDDSPDIDADSSFSEDGTEGATDVVSGSEEKPDADLVAPLSAESGDGDASALAGDPTIGSGDPDDDDDGDDADVDSGDIVVDVPETDLSETNELLQLCCFLMIIAICFLGLLAGVVLGACFILILGRKGKLTS